MPKELWAEVVDCTIYLSNCCPTRIVQGKSPQQAWSRKKPTVSHIRVFGSIAYVHVPDQETSKLDDKSEKYLLLAMIQALKAISSIIQVPENSL